MPLSRCGERRAKAILVENTLDVALDEEAEWMPRPGIREHEVLERIERPARDGLDTIAGGRG